MGCGSSTPAQDKAHAPREDAPQAMDLTKGPELPDNTGEAPRTSTALYAEAATLTPDHPVQALATGTSASELRTTTAMYANDSWTAGTEDGPQPPSSQETGSATATYEAADQ